MGRILVVDDEPDHCALLQRLLSLGGHSVVAVHSSIQGVALAQHEQFDLILMDIVMPLQDGLTAAQQLQAHPATADVPVLLLTARQLTSQHDRTIAAQCAGVISKPWRLDELLERIQALTSRTRIHDNS